jgi:hypothetical protein
MDDIKRPQHHLPRRDYTQLGRPAVNPQPPAPPAPAPQAVQPPVDEEPLLVSYDYHSANQTRPAHGPKARNRLANLATPKILVSGSVVIILLVFGGFYLGKPAKKVGATAAQLAKQSSFSFYYPSPMPAGYSYVGDINAFQDGQAYFMLAKGQKHLVIHEQAATSNGPQTVNLAAAQSLSSPVGKVTLGASSGEPAAQVKAESTYILINSTGSVPQADLVNVINSLKITKKT